jgi:diaminopimelate epimerase
MKALFIKMQGLGNDFIVFDARRTDIVLDAAKIRQLADRRMGIGGDMVIVMRPPRKIADAAVFMEIFNFDSSEVGACGNATRCIAGFLMAEGKTEEVVIETLAGRLSAKKADAGVTVDMGPAYLEWHEIPLSSQFKTENIEIDLPGLPPAVAVGMGNPHAVFFVEDAEAVDLAALGPLVEHHPFFPQRTNVEFAQVLGLHHLRMRVWERGVGVTPACGSGACATVVAAIRRGLIAGRHARVTLDGGDLEIAWHEGNGHVLMTGPWAEVYRGEIRL